MHQFSHLNLVGHIKILTNMKLGAPHSTQHLPYLVVAGQKKGEGLLLLLFIINYEQRCRQARATFQYFFFPEHFGISEFMSTPLSITKYKHFFNHTDKEKTLTVILLTYYSVTIWRPLKFTFCV